MIKVTPHRDSTKVRERRWVVTDGWHCLAAGKMRGTLEEARAIAAAAEADCKQSMVAYDLKHRTGKKWASK